MLLKFIFLINLFMDKRQMIYFFNKLVHRQETDNLFFNKLFSTNKHMNKSLITNQ
jgi:hypothetical protein